MYQLSLTSVRRYQTQMKNEPDVKAILENRRRQTGHSRNQVQENQLSEKREDIGKNKRKSIEQTNSNSQSQQQGATKALGDDASK